MYRDKKTGRLVWESAEIEEAQTLKSLNEEYRRSPFYKKGEEIISDTSEEGLEFFCNYDETKIDDEDDEDDDYEEYN
ncbi:hypothetical protein JN00_0453 [Metamycoplasma subdolum]|uniref:Uncharacterized protein n=1 Tax=Metamycoplasma subdolum TaxID=92407 RepID=A0A3L9ZX96_9BACT|nr:hypothetical protein [Metamycoplasma subdolum]RMA77501.1 hypothetical protein JN00_0453 [Metamycoplasma subdolum]WPB50693.1 hypothetical protein R9C05_00880 [Metamycoplasma subdolum]